MYTGDALKRMREVKPMLPKAICVWGDSLAKGIVFDENRGRYAILRENCLRMLENELHIPIHNYSAMGRTASDCLREISKEELVPGGVAVIEFGGNDSDICWADVSKDPSREYPARSSIPQFKESLRGLIRFVRKGGMKPVLVSTLPIDGEKYYHWVSRVLDEKAILAYLGDPQMMYRWQERYANAVREVACQENARLLDLRTDFLSDRQFCRLFCNDGIHPNALGHQKLFRSALSAIRH